MRPIVQPGQTIAEPFVAQSTLGLPLRVLVVEDSKDDVVLLLSALRAGGFEPAYQLVDNAGAMRAALELQEWDVITSDHAMPQFSGPAALALAREGAPKSLSLLSPAKLISIWWFHW
jgi:CheY-like chemotaxis protein